MGRVLKLGAGILFQIAYFAGLLLGPAGTWRWWRAWVFIGLIVAVSLAVSVFIFPRRPDLMDERFKPPIQRGQPLADKIILTLLLLTYSGVVVFASLDVFHFHLLGRPGVFVSGLGLALAAGSMVLMYLSYRENAFAAPVVRLQAERQHRVIDSGVYSVVRHPMYAAAVAQVIGMPLWLGSYAGALVATVPITVLVLRILVEERFLRRELTGYEAYTGRVRYRLIPRVW